MPKKRTTPSPSKCFRSTYTVVHTHRLRNTHLLRTYTHYIIPCPPASTKLCNVPFHTPIARPLPRTRPHPRILNIHQIIQSNVQPYIVINRPLPTITVQILRLIRPCTCLPTHLPKPSTDVPHLALSALINPRLRLPYFSSTTSYINFHHSQQISLHFSRHHASHAPSPILRNTSAIFNHTCSHF